MASKLKSYNLEHRIVIALRKLSRSTPWKTKSKQRARIGKNLYECNLCKKPFRGETIRIDHIEPVGIEPRRKMGSEWCPTWDTHISRLFCDESNLQVLCLDCHDKKTKEDKKLLQKQKEEVINLLLEDDSNAKSKKDSKTTPKNKSESKEEEDQRQLSLDSE